MEILVKQAFQNFNFGKVMEALRITSIDNL